MNKTKGLTEYELGYIAGQTDSQSLKCELVEAIRKRIKQCCADDLPPDQPYECCTNCRANMALITRAEASL